MPVDARYDAARDALDLEFRSGGVITIPRRVVPGLGGASPSALDAVRVSPAGDALSWPSLDVDIYVPGLVERVFGTRLFARATGQRGGLRRSTAKADAARANGAKGGASAQATDRIAHRAPRVRGGLLPARGCS